MFEFFQGTSNFFNSVWSWFSELFKFFDVVRNVFSSCCDILSDLGLLPIVGILTVFLSVLLISKILGK